MTRKQFLRIAAMFIAMAFAFVLRVETAQAQCPCGPITIDIDPDVQCWVPITVWCDDGTVTDLNGGNYYPPGPPSHFEHCPCPGANITQISLGLMGPTIPVPTGPFDVTFAGDCCLRIDINCTPGGGITIHIARSPLC